MLLIMTISVLGQCNANLWIRTLNSLPHSHFAKQNLPKIRFDNPSLIIEVERARKKEDEHWRPEMELEFGE